MRAWILAMFWLAACHDGASSDPGAGALLQVLTAGAQFRPGPFPGDEGGPPVVELVAGSVTKIGDVRATIRGTLDPAARGWVLGVDGIGGSWILPSQVPDLDAPTFPSAHARIALADDFPPGPFTLEIAASDVDGNFGPAVTSESIAEPEDPPAGELVVELVWGGRADLDIHVVEPGINGGEAFSDHPNTFDPPIGEPQPPTEFTKHGILDHDGNTRCTRLGHPNEHVVWMMPPPAGDYIVRVDTPSLCGDASATWFVAAYRTINGVTETLGTAQGISTPANVLSPRGRGAGILALRFSL